MIVYLLELFDSLASDGVEVIGTTDTDQRVGVVSFSLPPDRSPVRLGQEMAQQDVCIRCGLQCAHPFHTAQDLSGSCRVSLWLYNEY
jgi:cysteine desulfurase/selenocysteine lyase